MSNSVAAAPEKSALPVQAAGTQLVEVGAIDVRALEAGLRHRAQMVEAIKSFIGTVLKKGIHYDIIPGTSRKDPETGKELAKPSLLQPGAEDLVLAAGAHVEILKEQIDELAEGHCEVTYWLQLLTSEGRVLGQGVGSCSTMESKYRWRFASRTCPVCKKETVLKSKKEGEGWFCWTKKGGCGQQFKRGDRSIEDQVVGKVPNEDIADHRNTVRKMAYKRALVGVTKVSFGVSSLFTQLDEDEAEGASHGGSPAEEGNDFPEWDGEGGAPRGKPSAPAPDVSKLDPKRLAAWIKARNELADAHLALEGISLSGAELEKERLERGRAFARQNLEGRMPESNADLEQLTTKAHAEAIRAKSRVEKEKAEGGQKQML